MISRSVIWTIRSSVRCWQHRAAFNVALAASRVIGWRWYSAPVRGVSGMEEILARVVAPLPSYETRDKSPPPPESNSLEFMHFYRSLDKEDKVDFLLKLSQDYEVDHQSVAELAVKLLDNQLRDLATILQVEDRLRYSLTPRYKHLFCHISRVEGGVKFLVDLRADVLEIIASKTSESPHIRVIRVFTFSTGVGMVQIVPFAFMYGYLRSGDLAFDNIVACITNLHRVGHISAPPAQRQTFAPVYISRQTFLLLFLAEQIKLS